MIARNLRLLKASLQGYRNVQICAMLKFMVKFRVQMKKRNTASQIIIQIL